MSKDKLDPPGFKHIPDPPDLKNTNSDNSSGDELYSGSESESESEKIDLEKGKEIPKKPRGVTFADNPTVHIIPNREDKAWLDERATIIRTPTERTPTERPTTEGENEVEYSFDTPKKNTFLEKIAGLGKRTEGIKEKIKNLKPPKKKEKKARKKKGPGWDF